MIWTARLRTGRVVIFQASGSRAFRAAALIAAAAEADLAVIASAGEADSVGWIASVVAVWRRRLWQVRRRWRRDSEADAEN